MKGEGEKNKGGGGKVWRQERVTVQTENMPPKLFLTTVTAQHKAGLQFSSAVFMYKTMEPYEVLLL